jgi:hypothetical protein
MRNRWIVLTTLLVGALMWITIIGVTHAVTENSSRSRLAPSVFHGESGLPMFRGGSKGGHNV